MSSPQGDMAAQPPQSLPSFAQTFGTRSLNQRSPEMNNSLPPIQHRASPFDRTRSARTSPQPSTRDPKYSNSRKRLHSEALAVPENNGEGSGSDDRRSPRTVRIKQEADTDSLPPPKTVGSTSHKPRESTLSPPSSSDSPIPSKKRRTTISGIVQPINTDVRRPSVDNGISPVVMGFTIPGDDPNAMEQVRSMINLKQQQQALIEQRRGSTAGIVPPTAPPDVNVVNPLPLNTEGQPSKSSGPTRLGRRSPNLAHGPGGSRRSIVANSAAAPPQMMAKPVRAPSPPPVAPAQPLPPPPPPARPTTDSPPSHTHVHPANALPAPSISFSHRRASRQLGKGKPADIVISPRTASEGHLQPIIQSAPPIPRGGGMHQMQSMGGRLPSMAIPSLFPVPPPSQVSKRISTGQVPPTPTRFGIPRHSAAGPMPGVTARSPPAASVPISATLVPPTPASLHHPGYSGEKSAFLAPFEMFYDALSDSKQLKSWLSEQLHKSNALMASLQRQQDQLEETVNALVDKKVSVMREEVYGLRVRVDELESALRSAKAQGYSPNMSAVKGKSKSNGYPGASPIVPEAYTFPPVDPHVRRPEPVRRVSSPTSESHSFPNSQTNSPVPFDVGRRLSVSAMRLESRPPPPNESLRGGPHSHLPLRELPPHNFPPPPTATATTGGKGSWSPLGAKTGLPTSSTRSSLGHNALGGERPGLVRRSSGQGAVGLVVQGRMQPPEKRRASRSPDADEEGRGPAPPLPPPPPSAQREEQRRESTSKGSQRGRDHHRMDE